MPDNQSDLPFSSTNQTANNSPENSTSPPPAAEKDLQPNQSAGGVVQQTVLQVETKVKNFINKVENPADLSVRATFGYKPTPEEQKKHAMWVSFAEKAWWVLALGVVALILVLNWTTVSSFYCLLTNCAPAAEDALPTLIPEPTPSVVSTIFSGRAMAIDQDLGWLRPNFFSKIQYYSAGEVISGGYVGAKRYYAAVQRKLDQVFRLYEFYQLSSGEVVLIGGKPNVRSWVQNMQDYYLGQYFANEVRFQDEMLDDFPNTISLNETMWLYKREVLTGLGPYDCNVHQGTYFDCAYYGRPELALSLSPREYIKLPALQAILYKDLSFYAHPYTNEEKQTQIASNLLPADYALADKYIQGGSKVVVQDSTGINMIYELVFKDQYENYQRTSLNNDLRNLGFYQQELMKYVATEDFAAYKTKLLADEQADLPVGKPNLPTVDYSLPGFVFTNKQFQYHGEKTPQYSFYIGAFSSICSRLIDGKVMNNIKVSDLEEIGRVAIPQAPIYRLKDVNHPLNQMIYNLKIASPRFDQETYKKVNQDRLLSIQNLTPREIEYIKQGKAELTMPSLADYLASYPLLFIVDAWQRPIAIWEADLEFLSNCVIISEDNSIERVRAF